MIAHSLDLPGAREGQTSLPPVPMRMESILGPGVKTVLGQETPPPKPPRNDRPEVVRVGRREGARVCGEVQSFSGALIGFMTVGVGTSY